MTPPVLFLIFNRPDTTQRVFDEIRVARPGRLFVAADGPRADRPEDQELCKKTRDIALEIDWDCEVKTLFREKNLGCKYAVSSAITWFFSQVDHGIILEDDCLPHQSFFPFCHELLERYKDDKRIMTITGGNYQFGQTPVHDSYYFSRFVHVWGWATWKRAWDCYDREITAWPDVDLHDILYDRSQVKFWSGIFDAVNGGHVNTWDFQWVLSCWIQNGLSIIPANNLISNIGMGAGSTHTKRADIRANQKTVPIDFPLRHPNYIIRNATADRFTEMMEYSRPGPTRLYYLARLTRKLHLCNKTSPLVLEQFKLF